MFFKWQTWPFPLGKPYPRSAPEANLKHTKKSSGMRKRAEFIFSVLQNKKQNSLLTDFYEDLWKFERLWEFTIG
jgi:hypothetical protein